MAGELTSCPRNIFIRVLNLLAARGLLIADVGKNVPAGSYAVDYRNFVVPLFTACHATAKIVLCLPIVSQVAPLLRKCFRDLRTVEFHNRSLRASEKVCRIVNAILRFRGWPKKRTCRHPKDVIAESYGRHGALVSVTLGMVWYIHSQFCSDWKRTSTVRDRMDRRKFARQFCNALMARDVRRLIWRRRAGSEPLIHNQLMDGLQTANTRSRSRSCSEDVLH